jgi:hypothetical protein
MMPFFALLLFVLGWPRRARSSEEAVCSGPRPVGGDDQ